MRARVGPQERSIIDELLVTRPDLNELLGDTEADQWRRECERLRVQLARATMAEEERVRIHSDLINLWKHCKLACEELASAKISESGHQERVHKDMVAAVSNQISVLYDRVSQRCANGDDVFRWRREH